MSQDHPSKLTFSVEESVWLNKGQEIEEILAMELEPEITIHENSDHISIRGGLLLTGEYRQVEPEQSLEVEEGSLRDQVSFRSIEQVSVSDDGIANITHRFPIDVTIPQNRIKNLEDIYVIVESFDYDLPERGCIQLTADVSISGMTTELQNKTEPKQAVQPVITSEPEQSSIERTMEPFQFEARKAPQETTNVQPPPVTLEETGTDDLTPQPSVQPNVQVESVAPAEARDEHIEVPKNAEEHNDNEAELQVEAQKEEAEVPKTPQIEMNSRREDKVTNEKRETVSSIFSRTETPKETQPEPVAKKVEEKARPVEDAEDNVVSLTEAKEESGVAINLAPLKNLADNRPEVVVEEASVKATASRDEEVNELDEEPQEKTRKDENALYLTKMLTKGEEQFSKLKMCIIQENESLETIAARYEVSASHLIRVNRLDDESVEEGQILYIPVTSNS
ncbi:stage VI sporulation protein D [Anaerobacillus sp. MEB173]|uniref:stage VI sporulation protein D n=1 Tax=Anaerobacillus sp. MEB173 TaxID=3383345 RepID=UPI003F93880B